MLLALLETYPDDRRIVESIYEMLDRRRGMMRRWRLPSVMSS